MTHLAGGVLKLVQAGRGRVVHPRAGGLEAVIAPVLPRDPERTDSRDRLGGPSQARSQVDRVGSRLGRVRIEGSLTSLMSVDLQKRSVHRLRVILKLVLASWGWSAGGWDCWRSGEDS